MVAAINRLGWRYLETMWAIYDLQRRGIRLRSKLRARRASKLDAYTEYVDRRMAEGLANCVVMHRELRVLGYDGGYSILKSYVSPRRRRR